MMQSISPPITQPTASAAIPQSSNPLAQLFHNIAPPHAKALIPHPLPPQLTPPPKSDARLPLEVTASIQKLYLPPQPMDAKGSPGLDPQPGWGGRGR